MDILAQVVGPREILVVLAYLLVVGYLGWLGFQRTKTAADYMVAGREIHPFVMALSYGATFISTSAIVGFGGVAGMFGMSLLWLTFLNIFVGIFIAFVCLGGPTRRMGHHLDAHTFPELLGKRYESGFIQVFTGLVIFLFIPLYAAAVLIGGCEFIATKFGIQYNVALLIFSVIIAVYVIIGGLKGVMYTDALQGSIMFIGMIVLLFWTYSHVGGVTQAHKDLTELGKLPSLFKGIGFQGWTTMPEFGWGEEKYNLWWIVVSTITLGVGIGVLAQPQLAVRFMTVKSRRELNRAVLVGGIFILIMTGVAFTVGSLSNLYFHKYEKIEGEIISKTDLAWVIAKDERDLVKKVPCELWHIDTNDDAMVDINIVARGFDLKVVDGKPNVLQPGHGQTGAIPFSVLMPKAEIVEELEGDRVVVASNATSYLRALVQKKSGDWAFNTDSIIPIYITNAMPAWFGLIFLLTLLAAAMSTLSSQFHAVGTSIGRDVYERLTGSTGMSIGITRIGIIIGIVIAVLISHYMRGGYFIARATAIFFGLCGSAFLPSYIGGLFFKGVTRPAAKCSILTGFVVTLFWLLFVKDKEARAIGICKALFDKHSLFMDGNTQTATWAVVDPMVVALPLSLLVLIVVSLITRVHDQDHVARCFGKG